MLNLLEESKGSTSSEEPEYESDINSVTLFPDGKGGSARSIECLLLCCNTVLYRTY